jgi:predicted amidohydrolase
VHAYDLSPETVELAERLDGPVCAELLSWAREYGMTVLAGLLTRDGDEDFNTHVVARPDGTIVAQHKHCLTDAEREAGISPGPRERTLFEIGGVHCAILVCADTGMEGIADDLAAAGVEMRFIPTAGGGTLSDMLHESDLATDAGRAAYAEDRKKVFKPGAIDEDAYTAYASANALGYDGRDACHRGHCMIVDRNKVVRAQIPGTNVLEHQQDQMAHAVLSFE